MDSIIDKFQEKASGKKYTEKEMLDFATRMMDQIADMLGHEATKEDLKEWEIIPKT